jgi:hypothetical protein
MRAIEYPVTQEICGIVKVESHETLRRRKKMKGLIIVLAALFAFSTSAFAQMGNNQGNNMMGGDSWGSRWGMGYGFGFGWVLIVIVGILVIFGIVYMIKLK